MALIYSYWKHNPLGLLFFSKKKAGDFITEKEQIYNCRSYRIVGYGGPSQFGVDEIRQWLPLELKPWSWFQREDRYPLLLT
jgi:hypothetical protein